MQVHRKDLWLELRIMTFEVSSRSCNAKNVERVGIQWQEFKSGNGENGQKEKMRLSKIGFFMRVKQ